MPTVSPGILEGPPKPCGPAAGKRGVSSDDGLAPEGIILVWKNIKKSPNDGYGPEGRECVVVVSFVCNAVLLPRPSTVTGRTLGFENYR